MLRMRFGSFVWPNNPRTYTISCKRQTAVHKVPMGGFVVRDAGTPGLADGRRVFYGAGADAGAERRLCGLSVHILRSAGGC